jgi:hypothetical protein
MAPLLHFFSGFVIALVPRSLHPRALVVGLSLGKNLTKPLHVINTTSKDRHHFTLSAVCVNLIIFWIAASERSTVPACHSSPLLQGGRRLPTGTRGSVTKYLQDKQTRICRNMNSIKKAQHGKFISRSEHSGRLGHPKHKMNPLPRSWMILVQEHQEFHLLHCSLVVHFISFDDWCIRGGKEVLETSKKIRQSGKT